MLCSHSHRHYSWQILRILRENFTLLFAKTERVALYRKKCLELSRQSSNFFILGTSSPPFDIHTKKNCIQKEKKFAHHINLFQLQRSRFASVFLWKKERNGQQLFFMVQYELFGGIDCEAQMSFKTPPHLFLPDVLITRTMEKEY